MNDFFKPLTFLEQLQVLGHLRLPIRKISLAQKSNLWRSTVWFYEKRWRLRSTRLLSGKKITIDQELAYLCEQLNLEPQNVVLDVGTSSGLYSRTVQKYAQTHHIPINVVGIDISKRFVDHCNALIDEEKLPHTRAYVMDARQLCFKDESFDKIMVGGTFNELSGYEQVFQELYRVLKPKGMLFSMNLVSQQTLKPRFFQTLVRPIGIHIHTQDFMNHFFTQQGFMAIHQQCVGSLQMGIYQKK